MADRFPGYDVLSKRGTQSWNPRTRAAVDRRLAMPAPDGVLDETELMTLRALVARIAPQPRGRPPANTVALLLEKVARNAGDGFRPASLPATAQAWRIILRAIEAEAQARWADSFAHLASEQADALLRDVAAGSAANANWEGISPALFWSWRIIPDIVAAHWSHPSTWSAMGFGGPASPRGYVRLATDRRDPWEAEEKPESSDAG